LDITILLVEDDEWARESLKTTLEADGYVVLEACNGKIGLETWRNNKERVTLIISDHHMPLMTGEEMLATIIEEDPSVLVIIMCAAIESSMDFSQARAVFPKPLKMGKFSEAINFLASIPRERN